MAAWLLGITRRQVADHYARMAKDRRVVSAAVHAAQAPPGRPPAEQIVDRVMIGDGISRLPEEQRRALRMAFFDGLKPTPRSHPSRACRSVGEEPDPARAGRSTQALGGGRCRILDADDLALFAIGERPDPELAAHVTNCAQCTADIVRWRDTADLARQADLPGWVPAPPPGLWAKIVAELDLPAGDDLASGAVATGRRTAALRHGTGPADQRTAGPADHRSAGCTAPPDEATPGPDQRPSRWRRLTLPIAAGLAGLLIGAGVVFAIQRSPSPTVEKSATLIGLPSGWPEVDPNQPVGDAQLVNVDGNRQLQVETGPLPPSPVPTRSG